MPANSSNKTRRQKVRQELAGTSDGMLRRLHREFGFWPILGGLFFWVGVCIIALWGTQFNSYSIDQIISRPLLARVDFQVENEVQTKQKIRNAELLTPSHYAFDQQYVDSICKEFRDLFRAALAAETFEAFQTTCKDKKWPAEEELYSYLRSRGDEAGGAAIRRWYDSLQSILRNEYTISPRTEEGRDEDTTELIIVTRPVLSGKKEGEAKQERIEFQREDASVITDKKRIEGVAARLANRTFGYQQQILETAETLLTRLLMQKPILVYDREATMEAITRAIEKVGPALVTYKEGAPYVAPRKDASGKRLGLTATDISLIESERRFYHDFITSDDPKAAQLRKDRLLRDAGLIFLFGMMTSGLFLYVGYYRPRILQNSSRTFALMSLLLLLCITVRLLDVQEQWNFLIPVPALLAAAVLTLAYDRRFAIGTMAVATSLVAIIVNQDLGLILTLMTGVAVYAFLMEDVKTRTQIMTTGLLAGLVMAMITMSYGLATGQSLVFVLKRGAMAAISAILAGLIVHALLPYIEKVFRIATTLTLLEWRDANKPMLRRLVQEAPGTYNHSLVLGTMAQAACEAIGANGLLAQVGALYHDIGKIHQSEYYAENQQASINRHDRLEPRMSLLVILSHVKNGLAMASEYGLPRVLHQFIAEHHGTTVVRYFHHRASEKQPKIASGKHDRSVPETEFRYEGPKPQSRETAILMLCDGVEGAVRALAEPTAGRIETVVHGIAMDRLQDGQFDDCDITLKELNRVEESLVKSLCRFYHGRIAYPKPSSEDKTEAHDQGETPESDASAPVAAG